MFQAKISTLRDRNSMDLTETKDIKKTWQEYKEELYKKDLLHDPNNHDDVITHLDPDVLECKIKWGLGSIKNTEVVCHSLLQWTTFCQNYPP